MNYKFGKLPAIPGAITFKFGTYFDVNGLPTPPIRFGHELIGHKWGVLGNDKVGDCSVAGAAHEHMTWTHMGARGAGVDFREQDVIADYAAISGYDGTAKSDVGASMPDVASYRRKTGILDARGVRHKIDAYVALNTGSTEDLALATYITGAVGVGVRFPASALKQFEKGVPWTIVPGDKIVSGHYVPCIGRNSLGNFLIISWGSIQAMTPSWYEHYSDEALGYLSLETLKNNLSPEGFDADTLARDLNSLAIRSGR